MIITFPLSSLLLPEWSRKKCWRGSSPQSGLKPCAQLIDKTCAWIWKVANGRHCLLPFGRRTNSCIPVLPKLFLHFLLWTLQPKAASIGTQNNLSSHTSTSCLTQQSEETSWASAAESQTGHYCSKLFQEQFAFFFLSIVSHVALCTINHLCFVLFLCLIQHESYPVVTVAPVLNTLIRYSSKIRYSVCICQEGPKLMSCGNSVTGTPNVFFWKRPQVEGFEGRPWCRRTLPPNTHHKSCLPSLRS